MIWNRHSALVGQHAFLSASKPHWLNYDDDKLINMFNRQQAAAEGTRRHAFAAEAIRLGERLPKVKRTLNMYVNDCIGWHMEPEKVLYYSRNCFGTADAIAHRAAMLKISDLKTGEALTSIRQLMIYAGLFFLEYKLDVGTPFDNKTELRIYQHNKIKLVVADPHDIIHVMDQIEVKNQLLEDYRWEAGL